MVGIKRAGQPKELAGTNREFKAAVSGMSTKEAYDFYKKNQNRYQYNTEEIKRVFRKMHKERCAFCTQCIPDFKDAMTVEHIQIKRDYPRKIFQWNNLLCACHTCNTKRGTAPYQKGKYLDPTKIPDIERYFSYKMDGDIVPNKELSPEQQEKAEYMIEMYKLRRDELVCQRRAFLRDLMDDEFYEILKKKDSQSRSIIFSSVFKYYTRGRES